MAATTLLIDGDQYLYRACVSVERVTKWDDENHVLISNEEEAWSILHEGLQDILTHFGTKQHVVALGEGVLGDGKNFRYSVDPNYKSKRAGNRKPMCYANVRARLVDEYNVVTFSNLEADDVLGILATKPGPTDRIIVARDKDLKTIPGKLWDGKNFMQITEVEADYWHMYQTLCGDTTDGYPGCKGRRRPRHCSVAARYNRVVTLRPSRCGRPSSTRSKSTASPKSSPSNKPASRASCAGVIGTAQTKRSFFGPHTPSRSVRRCVLPCLSTCSR
jgi:DNA polymerase-1